MKNYRVRQVCFLILTVCLCAVCASHATEQISNERAKEFVSAGRAALKQGNYQNALTLLEQAVGLFELLHNQKSKGRTLVYIGRVYFEQADYSQALQYYQKALACAEATGDPAGKMAVFNRIGDAHRREGRFLSALNIYKQGLEIAVDSNIRMGEAILRANIGVAYTELGQYFQAARAYQRADRIFEELDSRFAEGEISLSMGIMYARIGRFEEALRYAKEALDVFRRDFNERHEASTLSAIGGIYDELGQGQNLYYFNALARYRIALETPEALRNPRTKGFLLNNIGLTYAHLGRDARNPIYHFQALDFYNKSLELLRQIGADVIAAKTLDHIGETHLHLNSYQHHTEEHLQQAERFFREALEIQERLDDPAGEWKMRAHLGQVYEEREQIQQALQLYREALDMMENVVSAAGLEEFKISLSEQTASTYQRAILLLSQTGRSKEAFQMSEHARARAFLDLLANLRPASRNIADQRILEQEQRLQLELAELRRERAAAYAQPISSEKLADLNRRLKLTGNRYEEILTQIKTGRPEYASLIRVVPFKVEELQQTLDSETTLLSYFVTSKATLAFIITHNDFQCVTLPLAQRTLQSNVYGLRRKMSDKEDVKPLLEKFYTQLVTPLEAYLTTSRIGIIPHDILHYLPFAALAKPLHANAPHYFSEDYTLFTLPGASVLPLIPSKDLRRPFKTRILAMANSRFNSQKRLPYTVQEVRAIEQYYARYYQTDAYISDTGIKEATETRFKEFAGEYDIAHLAAHGRLEAETPLFSSIALAPDAENDGRLEVHEIYDLNLERTRLVVLSACETQLGKRSRGDDIVGLTRAFLYAGASSVIASLWQVDDLATYELMKNFYLQLAINPSPARALSAAQRMTRAVYPHPYYWASFVLNGLP